MSRATSRTGVANWLAGIPGVAKVYQSFPATFPAQDWATTAGTASSVVAVVDIVSEAEQRIAIGGDHSGWKRLDYVIELHLYHRSTQPDPVTAMQSLDVIVDLIKTQLRSDRTMGGVFWQQGERRLSADYGEPRLSGGITQIWCSITIEATEMLNT